MLVSFGGFILIMARHRPQCSPSRGFVGGERIANRLLGTIEQIYADGNLRIGLDSGREAQFNIREDLHLDYGHAVTSHSSQGTTADRVLVHVDTEQAHKNLINTRLAYVAVSRARYDAQIYTNDAGNIAKPSTKEISKESALDAERNSHYGNDQRPGEGSHGSEVSRHEQMQQKQIEQRFANG